MLEKIKQGDLKNDIISSQKRCMRFLTETELVASKTNVCLKEQGETLVKSRICTENGLGKKYKKKYILYFTRN